MSSEHSCVYVQKHVYNYPQKLNLRVYQQTCIPVALSVGVNMPFWIFSLQGSLLFELYLITRCLMNKSLSPSIAISRFLLTMSVLPVLFWPTNLWEKKPWYVHGVVVYFLIVKSQISISVPYCIRLFVRHVQVNIKHPGLYTIYIILMQYKSSTKLSNNTPYHLPAGQSAYNLTPSWLKGGAVYDDLV